MAQLNPWATEDAAGGEPTGEPLVQFGERDGGMPGEAPPEQAGGGAELGLDPTGETVQVGTVRMEKHPDHAQTIEKLNKAGFEIRGIGDCDPRAAVRLGKPWGG